MNEIRIVIADDHPIYREGLRRVIERDAALRVLAEAGDGEEALAQIEACRPDVALRDLGLALGALALGRLSQEYSR